MLKDVSKAQFELQRGKKMGRRKKEKINPCLMGLLLQGHSSLLLLLILH